MVAARRLGREFIGGTNGSVCWCSSHVHHSRCTRTLLQNVSEGGSSRMNMQVVVPKLDMFEVSLRSEFLGPMLKNTKESSAKNDANSCL